MAAQAWVTITAAKITGFLNKPQFDALNTGNNTGLEARISIVIPSVVAQMRDDIESNGKAVLDANTATVPPGLEATAIWLVIEQLALSTAVALTLTDEQKKMVERAVKRMELVREGKLSVGTPVTSATTSVQVASATAIEYNELQCKRPDLEGL